MFARSTCSLIRLPVHRYLVARRSHSLHNKNNNSLCRLGGLGWLTLRRGIQQKPSASPKYSKPPNAATATPTTSSSASSPVVPKPALRILWNKLFGKYLLATNVISSGVLMVIGDVAAQEVELRRHMGEDGVQEGYDLHRIWRMFIVGALQGPLHHYAYKWMDLVYPAANFANAVRKILIDQLVMSPLCILIFFYSACCLERLSLQEANNELMEKFPYIYLMDWLLWPGAQYVNFRYMTAKYRVMFVNVCTAVYNVFMSYMKHDFDADQFGF